MMIFALLGLALTGMFGVGVAAVVMHKKQKKIRERRLSIITGAAQQQAAKNKGEGGKEAPEGKQAVSAAEVTAKLKKAAREHKAMADTKSLSSLIMQANLSISPLQFYIYSFVFGTVMTGILSATSMPGMVVGLFSFTSYLGFPKFFLKFKARRRQKAFLTDFADALEAMIRLLKAGMPVGEAIAMVAREFTGPVGDEMSRVYDNQKVGVPLQDAVRKMVPRVPLPEVQMFATSIAIQIQTGSSLSEVLGNLSGVIRARHRLKRKVEALSAEAKISAMIIGALPILVSLALWGVNPSYINLLFTHPTGKMLLFGAILWMSLGVLVMRQMINFKV